MNMRILIWYTMAFLVILPFTQKSLHADEIYSKTEAANRLYKQGKYEDALKLYEDALLLSPSENRLKMNRGSALYNMGDLDGAEKSYQGSLSETDKKTLATAHYNLGNILFKKGEMMQQQGGQGAQESYKSALEHYIQSLDLNPTDIDAKWNLQLAHQRIKQLEQQQQNKQDKNNKDKNDKDKNQQNKNKQNNDDQNKSDSTQQNKKQQDEDKKQKQNDQQNNKKEQENNKNDQSDKNTQEKQQQQSEKQDEEKLEKDQARRIIELYADDADSLNKPMKKKIGKQKQPEKDW